MQAIINGYATLIYGKGYKTKAQLAIAKKQLETISKLPKVLAVDINGDSQLVLHTDLITITTEDKITYEIGHFELSIGNILDLFSFLNKDRVICERLTHPNCKLWDVKGKERGVPCFGNIEDLIIEAIQSRNFVLLSILCLQFLESYHKGYNAFGHNIEEWPIYRKKE